MKLGEVLVHISRQLNLHQFSLNSNEKQKCFLISHLTALRTFEFGQRLRYTFQNY